MFSVDQEKRALWRSEIGEHEIGIVHWNHGNAFAPGWRWDFFYAGFYMGDLAVSIESSYDYCTQAEFVEVFLAIFDYVRELEILKHAGDLRGSPAVLPIPLQLCAEFTIYSNDLCNNI